jgi:hypothetical protein
MSSLDLVVHKYRKNAQGALVLATVVPYVSFSQSGTRISVQNGAIFDAGGNPLNANDPKEVPQWFWDAYAKLTPERQAKFKLKAPQPEAEKKKAN